MSPGMRGGIVLSLTALCAAPGPVSAWTAPVRTSLGRDARRLLPPTLARLLAERERALLEEAARLPPDLARALATDMAAGALSAPTLAALDGQASGSLELFRKKQVGEGLVRMGTLLRVAADLADPAQSAAEPYPPGVLGEYYAFVEANLDKIPVVLDDPAALRVPRAGLPEYWQRVLARSRAHSGVIASEMYRNGRPVDHATIDYRSPVFAVASLSYSRAVTAIAAGWLVVWREGRGDLSRIPTIGERRPQGARP